MSAIALHIPLACRESQFGLLFQLEVYKYFEMEFHS
jgi:hypothetical protein